MTNRTQTIARPFGQLTRCSNGLIYFHKTADILIDGKEVLELLKSIRELDNSRQARLIIVPGSGAEYTFDAQHLLLKNTLLGGLAFVVNGEDEPPALERSQVLSRFYEPKYPVAIFDNVPEAEQWHLNAQNNKTAARIATAVSETYLW